MNWTFVLAIAAAPWAESAPLRLEGAPDVLRLHERQAWHAACADVARRLGAPPTPWRIRFRRAANPGDFAARTGRPRFEAAAWTETTLWLQARATLARFGDLQAVRRHECVHAWRHAQHLPPLPLIVEEGLAAGVSQERLPPRHAAPPAAMAALARRLQRPRSPRDARLARSEALATVWPGLRALPPTTLKKVLRAIADRPAGRDWRPIFEQAIVPAKSAAPQR